MKNGKVLLFLVLNFSGYVFGQIKFEKGYFIDNENQKTECYIQNKDALKNPSEFKYMLTPNGEVKSANIKEVREFCIQNSDKFIRVEVDIDTSSSSLNDLSEFRNPLWRHKQLFLKVLIEGEATLYYYNDKRIERFFYSTNDKAIKQLIYKEYYFDNDNPAFNAETVKIGYNNTFRQQLLNDVSCKNTTINSISGLEYNKKELEKYFDYYNSCVDSTYKVNDKKQSPGEINLKVLTGFDYTGLILFYDQQTANFNHKINYILGIEGEYILPINKNKWGIAGELAYQSYQGQTESTSHIYRINYKSIDLSLGIKYYLLLNDYTKVYFDSYVNSVLNYAPGAEVNYKFIYIYEDELRKKDFKINPNFAFGAGFSYKRISAELRYYANQELLNNYGTWSTEYKKISVIIGYKLIKSR